MKTTAKTWNALTSGEKLAALQYAAYLTKRKWELRVMGGTGNEK